jgi:acetyl/propionyl-CoA carboxylase alpha subunit
VIRLVAGEKTFDGNVRRTGDVLEVQLDGTSYCLDVENVGPGTFVWRDGTRTETFHLVRDGARIHLAWRGAVYVLEQEKEGGRRVQRGGAGGLEAPMPGKVIKVSVEPGQAVKKGDEILVVEAMKMENALRAPKDGTVRRVSAKVGDMVSPGVVLVDIE